MAELIATMTCTYDEPNLFLFPDPHALHGVLDAHDQYDDPNEPIVLSASDYANYIEQMEYAA